MREPNGTKTSIAAALLALAVLGGSACSGSSDSSSDSKATTTSSASDSGGSSGSGSDQTTVPSGGGGNGHIEASVSSGATLSQDTTTCTVDGTSGSVEAADGDFSLTFADGTGKLTWTFDGGKLDEQPAVMVTGDTITLSGATSDGVGYNAEITCG